MYKYLANSQNKVPIDRKVQPEPVSRTEDKEKLVSRFWREIMIMFGDITWKEKNSPKRPFRRLTSGVSRASTTINHSLIGQRRLPW